MTAVRFLIGRALMLAGLASFPLAVTVLKAEIRRARRSRRFYVLRWETYAVTLDGDRLGPRLFFLTRRCAQRWRDEENQTARLCGYLWRWQTGRRR